MKRALCVMVAMVIILGLSSQAAAQPASCSRIKDGTVIDSAGNPIRTGYDQYGYNYQAHMFNGLYENFSRPATVVTESDTHLVMKWSPDWLSNMDCNGDGKLDLGYNAKTGEISGISKGWTTNHMEGDYLGSDGEMHHWTYFVKIAWVGPAPVGSPDPWADARIWGEYAIIQELVNDPFGGYGGNYRSKIKSPGLGLF